ncbi:hypothetical protein V5799_014527, partial [Amblyomma americanum]
MSPACHSLRGVDARLVGGYSKRVRQAPLGTGLFFPQRLACFSSPLIGRRVERDTRIYKDEPQQGSWKNRRSFGCFQE